MKTFARGLVIVLATTAFAFAAAKTGDITIKGKAGNVTNVSYGQNVKAETNAGSVKVGGQ